ncbi:MAG: ABC transporter substrate-binding protein [Thermoplasmata archaeon]|nr:ABC transporter substrate-binding protein [Thermoplasmata archaeon]
MDTKITAIIVAAIVIIAGAGAYLVLNGDDKSSEEIDLGDNYLKIFGNSNGDVDIDDADIQIIQNYIDGTITESDLIKVVDEDTNKSYYLADANLDGKVDSDDITFVRGIMDRSGTEMSLIDTFGHLVTVPLSVDRIACDYFATAELLMMVGVQDKIVCATNALMVLKDYYLQGADVDNVVNYYSRTAPDYEAVAEADPQIWVVSEDYGPVYAGNTTAVVVGLDTLVFDFDNVQASSPIQSALIAGYIFNNVEKAKEYVSWYLEKWDMLYSVTSQIADEDRPTVFYTGYDGYVVDSSKKQVRVFPDNTVCWQAVELAGGHNIIDDATIEITKKARPTSNVNIDLEWISEQHYDYLFAHCTKYTGSGGISATVPDHGYTCDDDSEYIAAQAHLGEVDIFANSCSAENMYLTPGDYMNGASGGILSAILVASVIHADLFPDLDLQAEHQAYIDMMGFDYNLSEHGVFFVSNE